MPFRFAALLFAAPTVNENDAYIFDVESPREWVFAGEPTWISGWFVSKVGAVFSDVRVLIDGVPHMGILGLPRPEIEQRYRGQTGLPHPGFVLRVTPPCGARDLRLELLDAGHRWVELWRTRIKVGRGPSAPGRYQLGLLPDHLHRLLQARRAEPSADLRPLARALVLEGAAVPLDTLPNPPFYGALEKPELIGVTQYGKLRVEGWLIHGEQRIVRLTGSTHPLVENDFIYGDLPRAEAGALFPGHPHAARSQYFGLLDIDETAPGPAIIKLFAELEDGTRHLVFARRFYPRACPVWEQPLPGYHTGEFIHCAQILRRAAKALHLQLGSVRDQWAALQAARTLYRREAPAALPATASGTDAYAQWQTRQALSPRLRTMLATSATGADSPRFTVLVDARECTPAQLFDLSASLRAQIHPHWKAWFIGGSAPGGDARLRSQPLAHSRQFATALNTVIQSAAGTHVAFVPGHSRLSPDALAEIARAITHDPALELIYTDEDQMDDAGLRREPSFKPDWSPALADSGLFPGYLSVVPSVRLTALAGFREDFPHLPWIDLLRRLGDTLDPRRVAHLPLVCHHARASVARETDPGHPSVEESRRSLADAVRRRGRTAAPFLPETGHHRRLRFHQLRAEPGILSQLPVTIVIPTRDRLHLLQECIELLDETVDWRHVKLVIVDDHSRDTDAVRYLAAIQQRTDLHCVVVRPADRAAPFNYSHLVNLARPHLDTPLVLHLNNDVNALEPGWLEEMATWFLQPDVGVVGAQLIYPDRSLNHTGIIIGPHGGLADTPFAKAPAPAIPVPWFAVAREVSAVTGACLLTRTALYEQLNGFDEQDFGVAYNDVDYCLRVRAAGRRIIYTPQAKLMHWGSATRGVSFDDAEHVAFVHRYPAYRDPYLSPHLRLEGNQLLCTPTATIRAERSGRLRMLLITHNLNYEGAPLLLLEYATWLVREAGFSLELLSAQDGPLRPAFAALGARVTVVDAAGLYASVSRDEFQLRLKSLAPQLDWAAIDLVMCNTLTCFWGVLLAALARKPALLYIHESNSPFRFFELKLKLELHGLVNEAFAQAAAVVFPCQATRAYYEALNVSDNFRLAPAWIGLDTIDAFRATHSRSELRRRHGFAEDETVIINLGTVCERKGQHVFIRAIDHFNRQAHRGKFRFVMVGARPGTYLDLLQRDIARLGLTNVSFVPETAGAFDYFVAADLFVCTSYEESFPRVVMEAMGFRTPIVSTNVHGIAELIGQRQHGYLVPPGDHLALSRMMWVCLAKERSGKSLTPTAYSRVLRFHDAARVLPLHTALARETFLGAATTRR